MSPATGGANIRGMSPTSWGESPGEANLRAPPTPEYSTTLLAKYLHGSDVLIQMALSSIRDTICIALLVVITSLYVQKIIEFCRRIQLLEATRSSADADKPARRVYRSVKVTKHSIC